MRTVPRPLSWLFAGLFMLGGPTLYPPHPSLTPPLSSARTGRPTR